MTDDSGSDTAADSQRLAPDDAFAVLGNDIRMDILRTLGEADRDVSFSTLYDAVDVDDSGQFSYHLDKMVGHFVADTDDGYRLALPGRRIVEAILSGAVTDRPSLSRTPVDTACPYCGSGVEIQWAGGGVELFCQSCSGRYGHAYGNCIFSSGGEPVVALGGTTELLALLTTHGLDPVDPESIRRIEEVQGEYEEEIVSSDPLRAAYTFTIDDDSVTITVDEDLAVVDVTTDTADSV